MSKTIVAVEGLHKSYGSVEVLKGVDLAFEAGEIHAFIGANGAGKSTFLGCLSGAVAPSKGSIRVGGKRFEALSPRLAHEMNIGIIYQHFQVIEGLTVAENIFLGAELTRFGLVNSIRQNREARALIERLGVELDPRTPLERLSIGERQIVEIARALWLEPELLILDEPTAALSDREIEALHGVVKHLAHNENLAIVYVTHLLDEVEAIADRVTILRDGQVVWTRAANETNTGMIAEGIAPAMEKSGKAARKTTADETDTAPRLMLESYSSPFTGPVDVTVRQGECLGIYGLLGSGRTDLLESLIGARPRAEGSMLLDGEAVQPGGPGAALDLGVALVASDRKEQSLFGSLSALDNMLMPYFSRGVRSGRAQRELFDRLADALGLHPKSPGLAAERFSGGNAQKLVMGRWLADEARVKLLLLDEPTQGVDVGAREDIYRLLRAFSEEGGTTLVASSDPAEIVAVADRVLVLAGGAPVALLEEDIREDRLVELAHISSVAAQ